MKICIALMVCVSLLAYAQDARKENDTGQRNEAIFRLNGAQPKVLVSPAVKIRLHRNRIALGEPLSIEISVINASETSTAMVYPIMFWSTGLLMRREGTEEWDHSCDVPARVFSKQNGGDGAVVTPGASIRMWKMVTPWPSPFGTFREGVDEAMKEGTYEIMIVYYPQMWSKISRMGFGLPGTHGTTCLDVKNPASSNIVKLEITTRTESQEKEYSAFRDLLPARSRSALYCSDEERKQMAEVLKEIRAIVIPDPNQKEKYKRACSRRHAATDKYNRMQYRGVVREYDKFLNKYPDSAYRPYVLLMKASLLEQSMSLYAQAAEVLQEIIRSGKDPSVRRMAFIEILHIYNRFLGDETKAREILALIPREDRYFDACRENLGLNMEESGTGANRSGDDENTSRSPVPPDVKKATESDTQPREGTNNTVKQSPLAETGPTFPWYLVVVIAAVIVVGAIAAVTIIRSRK